MKRQKTTTERWLISQLAMCRREINIYRSHPEWPNAGLSISHMERCKWNYALELRRHREREGIIPVSFCA
ncbi:MAG: hypothetical protein IJ064_05575 [Bacteroidaceae bacterium]|nr:hypothetical protein [Bacteroidaceae bacterium]